MANANNLPPIPPDKIAECQPWRDWFTKLFNNVSGGYTGTLTTASLVGKTVTIKNGIITSIQ